MKNILKLFMLASILLLSACNEFLDTKPEDFVSPINYYNNENQLNAALAAVYDPLGNRAMYGDYMAGRMGLDADEMYFGRTSELQGPSVFNVSTTEPFILRFWEQAYQGINRANLLLENLDKAQDIEEVERDFIEGQALFLRAYYHFMLVSNFGDVPLVTASLENAENTNVPRTPAKEVYDKVIEDMTRAESLVKSITDIGFGGRVNKSAVRGILARVCLYAAGEPVNDVARYAEARDWAKKVIDDGIHSLNPDYSQIFKNYAQETTDINESIFEVEFWGNRVDAFREGGRIGINNSIQTSDEEIGFAYGFILTTGKLFDLFEPNPADNGLTSPDLRRDWSIAPFRYSSTLGKIDYSVTSIYQRHCAKWRREFEVLTPKGKNDSPQNFPILRYSDILLMFAEAENEVNNGPTAAAYDAINQVRARAYGDLLPGATMTGQANLSGLDNQAFLQAILDERSREFSFECLRKRDLVRRGEFLFNMAEALRHFENNAPASRAFGALAFRNVSERDVYWPIPARELGLNSLLTQNPGW